MPASRWKQRSDRVGRELGVSYPSLAANIHMANLEIRAGRTMTEALEHLGDRLGLDEARSFATLIAQSEELGSSIGDALRVYSDDMRHKRLSRAEEKAYSLPAKLAVPMMVCIFPVLFIVILCPVIVRLSTGIGNYRCAKQHDVARMSAAISGDDLSGFNTVPGFHFVHPGYVASVTVTRFQTNP